MSHRAAYLRALKSGPKTNLELQFASDEIGPYVARDMAKLIELGLVENRSQPRKRALYALVDRERVT